MPASISARSSLAAGGGGSKYRVDDATLLSFERRCDSTPHWITIRLVIPTSILMMHVPNDIPKCCSIELSAKIVSGGKQSAAMRPAKALETTARKMAVAACSSTLIQRKATYTR
jgi:hypothetical protein